jgi:VanZ family protein
LSTFGARDNALRVTVLRLLSPLAWTALIAWFSTSGWSAAQTGSVLMPLFERLLPWAAPEQIDAIHWLIRKAAHVTEYGILAGLWRWALTTRHSARGWVAPLGLAIATATLDELHQATIQTRTGSATDVLLDSAAAAAALTIVGGGTAALLTPLTTLLLWVAAAGGSAMIALNWRVGAPSGWLWWSVPPAWIALAVWLLRRRPT